MARTDAVRVGQRHRGLVWPTLAALLATSLLPVALFSLVAINTQQRSLTERAAEDLEEFADVQAARLDQLGASAFTATGLVASRTQLRLDLATIIDGDPGPTEQLHTILSDALTGTPGLRSITLTDPDGAFVAGTAAAMPLPDTLRDGLDLWDAAAVRSLVETTDDGVRWSVAAPLQLDDEPIGVVMVELDIGGVEEVAGTTVGQPGGFTTCVYYRGEDGSTAGLLTDLPPRSGCAVADDPGATTGPAGDRDGDDPISTSRLGEVSLNAAAVRVQHAVRPDGGEVVAVTRSVPRLDWGVAVQINRVELLTPVTAATRTVVWLTVLVAALALIAALLLARQLIRPIRELRDAVTDIEGGDLARRVVDDAPGELGELGDAVNRMAMTLELREAESEERYQDLEVLTHAMAHDLKGPLTSIRGMFELLESGRVPDPASQQLLIERGGAAAVRMQGLIDDLLGLIRAIGAPLERRAVGLNGVIDAVVEQLDAQDLVTRGPLPVVPGDRILLEQVLHNLLSNAITYHAEGTAVQVEVTAQRPDPATVEIRVDDAGIGIPEPERDKVVETFYRGSGAREFGGTGLGLPIALRIAERHGGRLRIETSHLGGTRVVVSLPSTATVHATVGKPDDGVSAGQAAPPSAVV